MFYNKILNKCCFVRCANNKICSLWYFNGTLMSFSLPFSFWVSCCDPHYSVSKKESKDKWKWFSLTLWVVRKDCGSLVINWRAGLKMMTYDWPDVCVRSKLCLILRNLVSGKRPVIKAQQCDARTANLSNKRKSIGPSSCTQQSNQLLQQWLEHLQSHKGTLSCGTVPEPQLMTLPMCPKASKYTPHKTQSSD